MVVSIFIELGLNSGGLEIIFFKFGFDETLLSLEVVSLIVGFGVDPSIWLFLFYLKTTF